MNSFNNESLTNLILKGDQTPPLCDETDKVSIDQTENPQLIPQDNTTHYCLQCPHKKICIQTFTDNLIDWNNYLRKKFETKQNSLKQENEQDFQSQKTSNT